ncbi:palmdelphin-like [Synchiropus splendidus]|uniref:palmdelphin-like n=1 Tax=Synchiropus splendidus TaxID=270530 RepID=UPI00237E624A|nr:palmdelphin-like [Synchiropus splendidus]
MGISMEERGLLRERLHAITEKHRIQGDIRLKKQELDQEKLKLQHLKKRCLREQWLLQDSSSHNAAESPRQKKLLSDQQQTRALEKNIFRIEKELESLEREESLISTNESFILNRLKVVEKSPADIIKEAQKSFVADVPQSNTMTPNVALLDENTEEQDVFAMEVSVAKNLLTGESTVLSATRVQPEDIHQSAGQKVYVDSRSCVYALDSQEDSRRLSRMSVLSADEVEQLLRNAAQNKVNHQRSVHNHHRGAPRCCYNHKDEWENREGPLRPTVSHHGASNKTFERDCRESRSKIMLEELRRARQERQKCREERRNSSCLRCGQKDQLPQGQRRSLQDDHHGSHHTCHITRSCSSVSQCLPPRSHDPEEVSCHHPRLRYTPASHIPLDDYVSVEQEQVYCYNGGPAPSPLCEDDAPYTILNSLDTSEPITAVFMGFHTTEDDRSRDFEGSLKAELIVISDDADDKMDKRAKQGQRLQGAAVSSSVNGGGRTQKGPSVRKIHKKHKACCSVC